MPKYLDSFPQPVRDDLVNGRWLPVVGAGFSRNAQLPPGAEMPSWLELGEKLGKELPGFSPTSAVDAISAYCHEYSRVRLIEKLRQLLLIDKAKPGVTHTAFCKIPFDIVCTTNWDFLLDVEYRNQAHPLRAVTSESQLPFGVSTGRTTLLKFHGDLDHPDSIIATEDDYDGFLDDHPIFATYLGSLFIDRTPVFIGYSLDDPDLRYLWHVIMARLGNKRRQAYAVLVDPTKHEVARWERRGIKVIGLGGKKNRYGEILARSFEELAQFVDSNVLRYADAPEEEARSQLALPRDAKTRLCFFSVPARLLSLYREYLFPVVKEYGLAPVTLEDVVLPGDNIAGKFDAVLTRSAVAVVDATSANLQSELAYIYAKLGSQRVIAIVDERSEVPAAFAVFPWLRRTEDISDEAFIFKFRESLGNIVDVRRVEWEGEPERLLALGEYRAAVISAISRFEVQLRNLLESEERSTNLRQLLEAGLRREIVYREDIDRVNAWVKTRNRAVHFNETVTAAHAREIVNGVTELIRTISQRRAAFGQQ